MAVAGLIGAALFLTWPILIGPPLVVLGLLVLLPNSSRLSERFIDAAIAVAPVAVVAGLFSVGRMDYVVIAGIGGEVVTPTTQAYGWLFLILSSAGIGIARLKFARPFQIVPTANATPTRAVLDALAPGRDSVSVVHLPANRGKGHAVRVGLAQTRGTITAIQDADLELDPAQLKDLVQPILHGEADAVYGSRFLVPSFKVPFVTRVGNKTLTWMTNVMFGQSLTDMETCYKIIRGDIARALDLKADRFDIEPEITVALLRHGHKIVERPVTFSPRSRAAGKKMRWRDGFEAIRMLCRHRRG